MPPDRLRDEDSSWPAYAAELGPDPGTSECWIRSGRIGRSGLIVSGLANDLI